MDRVSGWRMENTDKVTQSLVNENRYNYDTTAYNSRSSG